MMVSLMIVMMMMVLVVPQHHAPHSSLLNGLMMGVVSSTAAAAAPFFPRCSVQYFSICFPLPRPPSAAMHFVRGEGGGPSLGLPTFLSVIRVNNVSRFLRLATCYWYSTTGDHVFFLYFFCRHAECWEDY